MPPRRLPLPNREEEDNKRLDAAFNAYRGPQEAQGEPEQAEDGLLQELEQALSQANDALVKIKAAKAPEQAVEPNEDAGSPSAQGMP